MTCLTCEFVNLEMQIQPILTKIHLNIS